MNKISTSLQPADHVREFLRLFDETARYKHRNELFREFVTLAAIALRNQTVFSQPHEDEYLHIIGQYEREDVERITRLMAMIFMALAPEPADILGRIFMDLELGNAKQGQFFTPDSVSRLMVGIQAPGMDEVIREKGYVTLSEPACGAGGMILAVVGALLRQGHNPSRTMFVEAIDIDRTAALMCYVQLSIWDVPAEVIVGDCLRMEYREHWFTPAYHLFGWGRRLGR